MIDVERAYQDMLPPDRVDGRIHTVAEEILLVKEYSNRATKAWVDNAGDKQALDVLIKVAAICVRCLENHRKDYSEK